MVLKAITISLCFALLACSGIQQPPKQGQFPRFQEEQPKKTIKLDFLSPLPLAARVVHPKKESQLPQKAKEKLYSFTAKDMPLKKAIELFSKSYELNVLIDNDIDGTINIDFHDLPFEQAMEAILSAFGYYWEVNNNLIRVRSWQTRVFNINYISLNRMGSATSEAQVSSGGGDSGGGGGGSDSGGGGGGGGGSDAGKIEIKQENSIEFWKELEEQLKTLISENGRLVINSIAGTIQVSDTHPHVKEVTQYINEINDSIHRQVNIEVKILEVTLNDDYSLGIDWTRLVSPGTTGTESDFNISNIISSPVGTGTALSPTLSLATFETGSGGENKLTAVLTALEEQGELQIVSQPHIRTMNNQSALIKVGTDRTFFRREQNTDSTASGSNTTTTDVPQVVTEGIVLAITPQISKDGWIMMDISPVVTRVSSVSEVRNSGGQVVSSAPNLDIRQTSSLIRAFNGETVIIGGLIQTQDARSNRGVPGFKHVPGIGKLFEGDYQNSIKKELVILLTPTLISKADLSRVKRN